ncbi:MAG: glycosyltransferase family 4 protein [Nitrospirota bacterium]
MSETLKKIKLIHVTESFGAGTFTVLSQIVNGLDPREYDISIVYSLRPETPSDFRDRFDSTVQLIHLPMVRKVNPAMDVTSLFRLWRILVEEKPDVVHLHSSKAGVLGRIAARFSGVRRVFYSPHGFSFLRQDIDKKARSFYRLFERTASRFGGTVIACSEGEFDVAKSLAPRTVKINNAVDVDAIDRLIGSPSPHKADGKRQTTIGINGRITPQRAPALFGGIAKDISRARPGLVRFLWIGGGEEIDDLQDSPVEITGWLSREDALRKLAAEVDVYLHTSLWEGMPIAVLEAMTVGKPVVATDVIGNRDAVIHGKTGFLCSDLNEFTRRLFNLIDDPRLRDQLGSAGRARVKRDFSLPLMIQRISALYEGKLTY